MSAGLAHEDLLDAYPRLTPAEIQAAIAYAADTIAHEEETLVAAPLRRRTAR